ncbi:MAG: ABC transporter substrate-binding protein [Alphaproteobacteria bacterium]|nr:ABC transporter substrate-binding protein [Alphaproteobacteria bacterium]
MSRRTTTLRAALLAATTLALAGLTSGVARAAGTLVWGMPAETDILDPHATGGWSTYQVTYQIFEGLVKEDLTKADVPTPPLVPALATSWEISPDGTVYTFKLRPGVKFHDGTPFDAAAVKFNFERFWDESSPNFYKKAKAFVIAYTKWIKSVEVVDPMTVRVTLKAPNYQWLRIGLQSYGQPLMISPTAVKKYGNGGIALHPIGTGPFRFVERDQGVKTVLERNPDYWGRPAKLDRIIFRPLQDPATRVNALENGEIQMMSTPPWDEIQRLVGEGFKLSTNANVPYINFLHLNFKNDAMKDIRVRKAINMAIDREGIAHDIYHGTGRAEYGMLSPGTDAYDPTFKSYSYDPEGAKKLLAEAGHAHDLKLVFELPQYGTGELVETWIQRDLKKVGIDVQLKKYEWITYMGKWAGGMPASVAFNTIGWGMSTPAWIDIVSRCDSAPPGGVNSGWYCNKEVDKLLDAAILERDPVKMKAIYQKANRLIMDDAAFVPTVDDLQPMLLSPKVKGFVNPPEDWFDLSTVSVE